MLRKCVLSAAVVAISAGVSSAQFEYKVPAVPQTCAGGTCRPVQAAVTAVHGAVVNSAEAVRSVFAGQPVTVSPYAHVPVAHHQSAVASSTVDVPARRPLFGHAATFQPGQPVRNVLRAVRAAVSR